MSGYLQSPWPAEDGGAQRMQVPQGMSGLALQPGESLRATVRRTMLSTMTVLGTPSEVYLMTHSALRARLGLATTARVELIDPHSLQPLARSPRLAGGPMWPGGMALHRSGCLLVVYGRHAHRLDRQCRLEVSMRLPHAEPCNGFVVLDNGLMVTKNLSLTTPARITVIDPVRFERACTDIDCPEPSVARLSAIGNSVYIVGVRSIMRYHWSDAQQSLQFDANWCFDYVGNSRQTHGWDVVLDGRNAWFMDNGQHRYVWRMTGAGVSRTANRLIRVSLDDCHDHQAIDVSGMTGGSITNPPLVDRVNGVVLGHDAANSVLQAWRFDGVKGTLDPLWRKAPFGVASHMLLFPDTAEVVVNDYRQHGEEVVVLDIVSGREKGRVRIGGLMQGVVFPSPGWKRDFYWSSMDRLARVHVA